MEKLYRVQMNSKGMPDFSTAVEIPSSDNHDWEKYSDKLWKLAYERGKEDEKRWWSGHCAKCTDADREQGEWKHESDCGITKCNKCGWSIEECIDWNYCPNCGAKMKGANNESVHSQKANQ